MKTRDTTLVGLANAAGRITGMVAEIVMSAAFGAGKVTDAFYAAFRVPQLLRELLAEGSLQNAFVPAFAESVEKDGLQGAFRLANAFLGVLLLVLGGSALAFFAFAPIFVRIVATGFDADPEKFALAVDLTRWMSPFLMGLSLSAFVAAMLNVRGKFFGPALAQNIFNLMVIAGCLAGPTFERLTGLPAIVAVAIGATASGFLQCAANLPALLREGYRPLPSFRGHPALRRMLTFFAAAIVGISTVQVNVLIESNWASTFGDGPVTWLIKSFRIVQIPLAVFSGSIAVTALASLSQQHARRDERGVGDTLANAFRLNTFLVLPSAVAIGVLAEPLVRLLYERGAFTPEATAGTAAMQQMYAFAVLGICFHRIAVPFYYALGDAKTPMWLSIAAMLAKVPAILLLTKGLGMGPEALPLSHAITVGGESIGLAWGLRGRVRGRGVLSGQLRIAVAAGVLGVVAWLLAPHLHVLLVCVIAGLSYLVVAQVLGVNELRALFRRGGPGLPPTVDDATQAALRALAGGSVKVGPDRVSCPAGAWRIVATDQQIRLEPDGPGEAGPLSGPVFAIMRPGQPPTLKGFAIGDAAWHADGDTVVNAEFPGPRIPVKP